MECSFRIEYDTNTYLSLSLSPADLSSYTESCFRALRPSLPCLLCVKRSLHVGERAADEGKTKTHQEGFNELASRRNWTHSLPNFPSVIILYPAPTYIIEVVLIWCLVHHHHHHHLSILTQLVATALPIAGTRIVLKTFAVLSPKGHTTTRTRTHTDNSRWSHSRPVCDCTLPPNAHPQHNPPPPASYAANICIFQAIWLLNFCLCYTSSKWCLASFTLVQHTQSHTHTHPTCLR